MLGSAGVGLLNTSLLWGLLAVAVPLLLHLWRRRRREVVDWGAMMFLDDGSEEPTRRAPRINDLALLAVRMVLLGLLAIALARPYWGGKEKSAAASPDDGEASKVSARGRSFVLAIDRSTGMNERRGGITPRALAIRWARRFISAMGPDDSAALVDAGARGRPRVEPTRDKAALTQALIDMETTGGGPSDLAASLDEAFRILADAPDRGPANVMILTDGRRISWRPEETLRWDLVRDLHRRLGANAPRIWGVSFGESATGEDRENTAVLGDLDVGRSPALAGRPVAVSTVVTNSGSRPITPIGQLKVDGRPQGASIPMGPIPPGGRAPLSFTTTIAAPGTHLVSIELDSDDSAEGLVEVVERIPVLIVDGKPSTEPFGGQADFLRIALDPRGANQRDVASIFQTRVVRADRFDGGFLDTAKDPPRVLVLADVAELNVETAAAVGRFVEAGGGLMVLLGDGARPTFFAGCKWFPGRIEEAASTVPTRLDPASFSGPTMGRFAMTGASEVPLSQAEVFRHRVLVPGVKAAVSAKLASGDPWCVERPFDKGRVLVVTTALDGRATTLPINPDFVPLAHEWILSLARGPAAKILQPGEPWIVPLDPPPVETKTIPLRMPGGQTVELPVIHQNTGDGRSAVAEVRIDDTDAPGAYRLGLDRPSYAIVGRDPRWSDPIPLSDEDRAILKSGWPLEFAPGDAGLIARFRSARPTGIRTPETPRFEFWRFLVLAALVGLCVESWLARRLTTMRGG